MEKKSRSGGNRFNLTADAYRDRKEGSGDTARDNGMLSVALPDWTFRDFRADPPISQISKTSIHGFWDSKNNEMFCWVSPATCMHGYKRKEVARVVSGKKMLPLYGKQYHSRALLVIVEKNVALFVYHSALVASSFSLIYFPQPYLFNGVWSNTTNPTRHTDTRQDSWTPIINTIVTLFYFKIY